MLKQKRNALRRVLALNLGEEMKGHEKEISVNIWNQLGWIFENCSVRWPREKKVLHSECHELILRTELWSVEPSNFQGKRGCRKAKGVAHLFLTQKKSVFNAPHFWANCMVDSLECFFFADPTFPNWAVYLFLGYRRKTKVEKKRRRVKTQVDPFPRMWCWKVKLDPGSHTKRD